MEPSGKTLFKEAIMAVIPRYCSTFTGSLTRVKSFSRFFTLVSIARKFQLGIRARPTIRTSITPNRTIKSLALDKVIENFLAGKIIEPARRGPYITYIFAISESNDVFRPMSKESRHGIIPSARELGVGRES